MRIEYRLCGVAFLWLAGFESTVAAAVPGLTLEQRVVFQRRIEEVYWRHRIWPQANPEPKPSTDSLVPDALVRGKVEDSLEKSSALTRLWGQPITTRQLQAELNRLARHTRSPGILRELFAALGDDPAIIAETLARQTLADRLTRERYTSEPREAGSGVIADTSFETWWADRRASFGVDVAATAGTYSLPSIATGGCIEDAWEPTRLEVPDGRDDHTAVWTGSEMIVWGGNTDSGGRYDPATDTWTFTSRVNAPIARSKHTAVWTGTEMIVWGGSAANGLLTVAGGRYDPSTDSWTATSTANAPIGRWNHTAVWTGTEMIVWGGEGTDGADPFVGGRYDPSTDSWTATSTVNAPTLRSSHTAVWTGSRMIVWGGTNGSTNLNTGGLYDPTTDTWAATSTVNAPSGRYFHSAVWTGTKMIVWGGNGAGYSQTGGRYDPSTDSWSATATVGAPSGRMWHTALWTGTRMIVWGGTSGSALATGGRYDPIGDTWTATPVGAGSPSARKKHSAVWTGTEMIVWGGDGLKTGGRYDPSSNSWTPTTTGAFVPAARTGHTATWTGAEMIVWGGDPDGPYYPGILNTGGRYDPATDAWTPTSTGLNVPSARVGHTAVWTGTRMIVWGGAQPYPMNDGALYDPSSDTWSPTSTGANAPTGRTEHTAVWTGTRMIVWGGRGYINFVMMNLPTGGNYDPATDSWTPTTLTGVPLGREGHTAVWAANEMIVWGGDVDADPEPFVVNTGGRYNPSSNTWTATSIANAPAARGAHTAIWTGAEMIVWGGRDNRQYGNPSSLATGGRYDPVNDTWTAVSTEGAVPAARHSHGSIWTGKEMIVWGGYRSPYPHAVLDSGARYDPAHDSWQAISAGTNLPVGGRYTYSGVWTGERMIVWGGSTELVSASGGLYCARACLAVGSADALNAFKVDTTSILAWDAVPAATSYDVLRGSLSALPVGSSPGTETCLAHPTGTTASDDNVPEPGQGSWYLVRARSECGEGSWGHESSGSERVSAACP
jgi:N-acetylneuraminic acid mutarotase